MKKKILQNVGFILFELVLVIFLGFTWLNQETRLKGIANGFVEEEQPKLYVMEETPQEILYQLKDSFPKYEVIKMKSRSLSKFLEGDNMAILFDVQALPFEKSSAELKFYPLYRDFVVLSVDKNLVEKRIDGWTSVKEIKAEISMTSQEPTQRLIWQSMSVCLGGKVNKEIPARYLADLYEARRLFWDNWAAPIQILFHSSYLYNFSENPYRHLVIPKEGTIAYRVGLLSKETIADEKIDKLVEAFEKAGYYSAKGDLPEELVRSNMVESGDIYEALLNFGEIQKHLSRVVLKHMRFAPDKNREHHVVAILLITFIVFGISHINKTVIYLGVRRGLNYTGFLLIGWIVVVIFKYAFYGDTLYVRILWYSYYIFILMLPPTGLYIVANINHYDRSHYPKWLIAVGIISWGMVALVFTNDYHQWVFRFLTTEKSLWHLYYRREWGYYLVVIWLVTCQVAGWIYLLRKSWDAPKRKSILMPIMAIMIGLLYSTMYNLNIPFFREISLVFGISSVVILYWGSILKSGLIQSNSGYHELFENSPIYMQIFDHEDKLRYQSALAREQADKDGDYVVHSTPISGGKVLTRESIDELLDLKHNLEAVTKQLVEENEILLKKEHVSSRLILLREKNELTNEVNTAVEDKIRKMRELLENSKADEKHQESYLIQIQRLALYCKRRCELLIRSKQDMSLQGSDLDRLVREINAMVSPDFSYFNTLKRDVSFELAQEVYECYHLFCEIAIEEKLTAMTARLLLENNEIFLHFMIEEKGNSIIDKFRERWSNPTGVSYKNLGDAFSMMVCMKGEEQ